MMTSRLLFFSLFMLISVFISSLAQVLLKKEAIEEHENVIKEYVNPRVIIAYSVFLVATFITIYAYKGVPLSLGPILEATGYIYATVFGVKFFGEKVSKRKIVSLGLIIIGIVVFACF